MRARRSWPGGKRLRPLLVVLAAASAGGPPADAEGEERLVRAAVAVELVHSATLVHDDLIDGAPAAARAPHGGGRRRARGRGRDRRSAVLARVRRARAQRRRRAAARAVGRQLGAGRGELLQREDAYARTCAVERYLRRCELKTAALFEAACRLGALTAAQGSSALADALGAFARRIGLAFQMLDDVLDVSGPVERTGKSRGTDLLDGTVTLPLILARERERELAELDLASLQGPDQAEALCERIAASGALEEARERALASSREAKAALPAILPARPRGAAGSGGRRGRRALQLVDAQKSDGTIRSASSARMKNSISSDMLAWVMRLQVAEQCAGGAVELVVQPLDGRLLEHALAPATRTRDSAARFASGARLPRPSRAGRPARRAQ